MFVGINLDMVGIETIKPMVLSELDTRGIFGSTLLHAGFLHIFGNMLFLWVFGNAVNAKTGNLGYIVLWTIIAFTCGITHLAMDGRPAGGASGIVNGMIGFYFALYPANKIDCVYWFIIKFGKFRIPGVFLILFWFVLDLRGALAGTGNVAYWAHVGGFLAGFACGLAITALGFMRMSKYDNHTLIQILCGRGIAPDR